MTDQSVIVATTAAGAALGLVVRGLVGMWQNEAFLGRGGELTILDRGGGLLAAASTDGVPRARIAQALTEAGYPWRGDADPYESEYVRFVQGRGDAEPAVEELLRERAVARAEKRGPTARDLRLRLGERGVVVRDRGDEQEFRLARHNG
ncbi:hypothetical protein TSST111916_11805 [Tsukamurella strandjordii]|uniref:CysS/YqeB C-terminal domain-containing protein n=1 Tax=Tsukamurella TaxID=2060 RepID=UPI001C7D0EE2|nr:hypothetical protein [Tsukamurella sp. TY48]GIZ96429.1 hypothetical protein TTY48_10410 [Tsukamurella sp. TY48]